MSSNDKLADSLARLQVSNKFSALESLPRDVMWKLIEYCPDSKIHLRGSSHHMRNAITEYALHREQNIVRTLTFTEDCLEEIMVSMEVLVCHSLSFSLRCASLLPPDVLSAMQRREISRNDTDFMIFELTVTDPIGAERIVELLRDCVGKRIEKTVFVSDYPNFLPEFFTLIELSQFTKLEFDIITLSDAAANQLPAIIELHKVEQLSLSLRTNASDPVTVSMLLQLSKLVRAMELGQKGGRRGIGYQSNFMFGILNENWEQIILAMFSNKLEKLRILNIWYSEYLPIEGVNVLQEKLPLLGKKIWFSATCSQKAAWCDEVVNGQHSVRVYASLDFSNTLSVKHVSLEKEPFE